MPSENQLRTTTVWGYAPVARPLASNWAARRLVPEPLEKKISCEPLVKVTQEPSGRFSRIDIFVGAVDELSVASTCTKPSGYAWALE